MAAINEYKGSETYRKYIEAEKYANSDNEYILNRTSVLKKAFGSQFKFHDLPNSFFNSFIMEWVFYALGNGLTLKSGDKDKLGEGFDKNLLLHGVVPACYGGCSYGFWDKDHVVWYSAKEAFPLLDERTGDIMVFIRFWQLDTDKPLYIDVFDETGVTEYKQESSGSLIEDAPHRAYKTKGLKFDDGTSLVTDTETYSQIPVIPLYVNSKKMSEFSDGFKAWADAYDAISSSGVNGIERNEGIIWLFNAFGGDDLKEMGKQIETRVFKAPEDMPLRDTVAVQAVEAPYQGKANVLDRIERHMRSMFMMPASNEGVQVTATEVTDAKGNMRIKSTILVWCVCDFVQSVFKLIGEDVKQDDMEYEFVDAIDNSALIDSLSKQIKDGYVDADYARARTMKPDEAKEVAKRMEKAAAASDKVTIENISTQLMDGYIDTQKALELAPNIDDDEIDEILDRLDMEAMEGMEETFPMEEAPGGELEEETPEDVDDMAGDDEIQALLDELEALGGEL